MVTELRWILTGLSLLLLGGIWWWGVRRAKRVPQNTGLRQPNAPAHDPGDASQVIRAQDQPRDWGVPPFEPLSIHTADFDDMELKDLPMTAAAPEACEPEAFVPETYEPENYVPEAYVPEAEHAAEHDVRFNLDLDLGREPEADRQPEIELGDVGASFDATEPTLEPEPHVAAADEAAVSAAPPPEAQRIVTIRVSAQGEARWSGTDLLEALESHGLEYGRYKVFHRRHTDGRTLFCVASLVEPGTFDMDKMSQDEFRGLTMFAVLPGPADSLYTIDALIIAASDLAAALHGVVQDSNGAPLSPQRAAALREDVAVQTVGHGRAGPAG